MKFNLVWLILSIYIVSTLPVRAQSSGATLTIYAQGTSNNEVIVNSPVDGFYFQKNQRKFELDSVSQQKKVRIPIDKQAIITVENNFRTAKLIVSPGDSVNLKFYEKDSLEISGSNAEGQLLLNRITNDNTRFRFEELNTESTIDGRKRKLTMLENVDLSKINALVKRKDISEKFANAIKKELWIYYKLLLSTNLFFTARPLVFGDTSTPVDRDFVQAWKELYKPINAGWAESPLFPLLVSRYSSLLSIEYPEVRLKKQPYMLSQIELLEKRLDGRLLEYAWGNAIVEGLANNENELIWIENFERFKKQFPQSKLIVLLKPEIDTVKEYHLKLSQATNSEVEFLDSTAQYSSLKELFRGIKGDFYYVDLWATWCGPCKQELQFSMKLHSEIEEIGYQIIYLSIDDDRADGKWREMVKGYPLKGKNMRASEALRKSLSNEVPKFNGIPRYLIVNSEGEIVEWDAKRPSDGTDLLEQLKSMKR